MFRKHLKTLYFQLAFSATPQQPTTQRLRFNFLILALYKSIYLLTYVLTWWRRGVVVNALVVINEVTLCRAQLVLTVCGRVNHLGM